MAAEDDPAAGEGRLAFEHTACVNCHTVNGTSAKANSVSRSDALGQPRHPSLPADQKTRRKPAPMVDDPNSMKPGSLMPKRI